MAAIKAGNSVWRSNAAYELGYLNPAIHRQIYTSGLNLPRTFGFKDPYVGNWLFRAPVFTKNGYLTPVQAPSVYQPGTQLLLPAHVPGTSILDTQAVPPVRTIIPKQTYVAPTLVMEQVAVPKRIVPALPYEPIPVGNGVQLQLKFPQPYIRPSVGVKNIPLPPVSQSLLQHYGVTKGMGDYAGMRALGIHPIENATQQTLFKKGGKVKKVKKCEIGAPNLYGVSLGSTNIPNNAFDSSAAYDNVVGKLYPGLAMVELNRDADKFQEKLAHQMQTFKEDPLGYNKYQPKYFKTDYSDITTSSNPGDITISTTNQFTQGSDQRTPYN